MSSHDIRHMTSRHDFMNIKFGIWHLVYVAVSEQERWFYFRFARYLGREIHSHYRRLGDLHIMHSRVTLKLKVTSWSTWPLLSLLVFVLPRWFFLLFRKDFRSGNSFQLSPLAWPSRLTLKLNVTSWSTWHMSFLPVFLLPQRFLFCFVRFFGQGIHSDYCHSHDSYIWPWNWGHVMVYVTFVISGHLYVSLRNDFCFVRFSGQRIHSGYCHLRDHHEWPWNVRSRHGLRALTTWQIKNSRRQWRDLRFSRSTVKITQLAIVRMNSLNQKSYETKKTIISVGQIQAEITKVT